MHRRAGGVGGEADATALVARHPCMVTGSVLVRIYCIANLCNGGATL